MNMSVPEACDVDSREKWDVLLVINMFYGTHQGGTP